VLVANLTNEERTIALDVPGMTGGTFRVLDEVSYETAAADPSYLTATGSPLIGADITLPPFAIACVDGEQ
jgi:hypothetical protein